MKGQFKLKKITKISEIDENTVLPESDLCFQDNDKIIQMSYEEVDPSRDKTIVKPGSYVIQESSAGVVLIETDIKPKKILPTLVNTQRIRFEMEVFFDNLEIYRELEQPMARKILLYSEPGCGKTVSVFSYCSEQLEAKNGTVVLLWPTSSVRSQAVLEFLDHGVSYDSSVSKLIITMEDIGGGAREGSYSPRGADSALLEFLDGGRNIYKVPTFVVATTNYPENLVKELADRPGRFDSILEAPAPNEQERIDFAEFVGKKPLSEEDREVLRAKRVNGFSFAHINEVVVRSRLHKKTLSECIDELVKHKKNVKTEFNGESAGTGFR